MSGLLRTTMVGAYPRPASYGDQLEGRDIREAFKVIQREEASRDAVGMLADRSVTAHTGLFTALAGLCPRRTC